ncbi:hypothetical protein FSP39_017358 [Pinctada imbricata]|uniref:Integrase catalytic domain-containing protein n=1 Tax=Pinctada imbricata TaxID=66713 RepID=A0AA88YU12_PINIB|nr:hypothetical protein FSP39_017358 [Pinctada imbricata]
MMLLNLKTFNIATDQNPADQATRKFKACNLPNSLWIREPEFLYENEKASFHDGQTFSLVDTDADKEVKQEVTSAKSVVQPKARLGCERFERFSSWHSLVRALVTLKKYIRKRKSHTEDKESCEHDNILHNVTTLIIKEVQLSAFSSEISTIRDGGCSPKASPLLQLNPILDKDDVLRVGGRLSRMQSTLGGQLSAHPIIIPKGHIATLIVRHFHSKVHHQGRQLTEGAVRTGVSRAVHVELIEELSSASFINALRRFIALRGPVQHFRSDRGTNFIGAVRELEIDATFIESGPVSNFLSENAITWTFNPPQASHFGGVWERMIGTCRRILDAILLENKAITLTHEVLSTFMAEVCAIVNSRPLLPITSDSEVPTALTPSAILTNKQSTPSFVIPTFGSKDALKSQWKLVQYLANIFWTRWRVEYLNSLQTRAKWTSDGDNFKQGDVVLVKDKDVHCNLRPLGVIDEVFASDDSTVRKVKVSIVYDGTLSSYVRPICQLVKLLELD